MFRQGFLDPFFISTDYISLLIFFLTVATAFSAIAFISWEEKTQGPASCTTLWPWKGVAVKKNRKKKRKNGSQWYLMYFQYMLGQLSISENAKEWTKITEEYICFYFLSNNWFLH